MHIITVCKPRLAAETKGMCNTILGARAWPNKSTKVRDCALDTRCAKKHIADKSAAKVRSPVLDEH